MGGKAFGTLGARSRRVPTTGGRRNTFGLALSLGFYEVASGIGTRDGGVLLLNILR